MLTRVQVDFGSVPSLESVITENQEVYFGRDAYEELQKWSQTTTSHGLPHIIGSKNRALKYIWTISLLVSVGFCSYMLARSITQYLSYGVTTTLVDINQKELPFPEVAICNVNPFSSPEAYTYLRDYYNKKYNVNINSFQDFTNLLQNNTINYDTDWLLYQTYDEEFNDTLRKSFGYDSTYMLSYCSINNTPCLENDFLWYYDPIYGNCYKFNSGYDADNKSKPIYYINREENGFALQIFGGLKDTEYKYLYENSYTGIAIIIGDQQSFPIKQVGILNPSLGAQIQLTKTVTQSMPAPYGDCVDQQTINTQLSNEMQKLGYSYNRQNCMVFCEQRQVIQQLGCYDMRLPGILGAPPCNNQSVFSQLQNIVFDYTTCYDDCPFECSTVEYDMSISYSNYPSYDFYLNETVNFPDYYASIFRKTNITYEEFEGLAYLFIFYSQLKYTDLSNSAALEIMDIISYMGGTLGLFIGISVLSFVEIVEFGCTFLKILFRDHFAKY